MTITEIQTTGPVVRADTGRRQPNVPFIPAGWNEELLADVVSQIPGIETVHN